MKKSYKNIAIFILSILFIFQLFTLWSSMQEDFNTETLKTYKKEKDLENLQDAGLLIKPNQLIFSNDDDIQGFFSIHNEKIERDLYLFLEDLFERAILIEENIDKVEDIIKANDFIWMEYNFLVPMEAMTGIYKRVSNDLQSEIEEIKRIIIYPRKESLSFLIYDGKEYFVFETELEKDSLYFIEEDKSIPFYIIEDEKFDVSLIPIGDVSEELEYKEIDYINPYEVEGELLFSGIEKMIDIFFEYPARKEAKPSIPYTFSDDKVLVRYYPTNVLEYNYFGTETDTNKGFISAIGEAILFMDKDKGLQNKYFLADYKEKDQGYIFYFDYSLDGYPLYLSEKLKEETGLEHIIEIEIENDKVVYYKKLTNKYFLKEEEKRVYMNTRLFLEEVGKLEIAEKIKDMKLIYSLDKKDASFSFIINDEYILPIE